MRRARWALEDVTWYARRRGVVRTARRIARICLDFMSSRIHSHSVTVVHCADLQSWPDYAGEDWLTIRTAEPADLAALAERVPPSAMRLFRARLAEGQIMFVALVGGEIAGYAWMCTQPDAWAPQDHGLRLQPGEGLHWDSVTFEEFRARGIYTALQRFSRAHMKAKGYQRVYGGADTRNPAPLRMMKTLALKPVHLYCERRILGRKRAWVEPIPADFKV